MIIGPEGGLGGISIISIMNPECINNAVVTVSDAGCTFVSWHDRTT